MGDVHDDEMCRATNDSTCYEGIMLTNKDVTSGKSMAGGGGCWASLVSFYAFSVLLRARPHTSSGRSSALHHIKQASPPDYCRLCCTPKYPPSANDLTLAAALQNPQHSRPFPLAFARDYLPRSSCLR